jgi:4-aminobutyrate aminotransferase-like enzyme
MEGERIRVAPPLTIETTALRQALEILLSRLDA